MQPERKYVITIAGFDPSGGAGLLADVKTFEQCGVYGLSVNTANTLQTAGKFYSIEWSKLDDVLKVIDVLLNEYPVSAVKTGIMPSFDFLYEVVKFIKSKNDKIKIVVDPIIKSSTDFDFITDISKTKLQQLLADVELITPNINEVIILTGSNDPETAAKKLAQYCSVLLKGGHNKSQLGFDYLYTNTKCIELKPTTDQASAKHGSGCVLSAAIAAHLAMGYELEAACINAKKYVEQFLSSNKTLLGYHHVQ